MEAPKGQASPKGPANGNPNDTPRNVHLARVVLFVFLLTFIVARVLVFLIMSRRIPDLYLHLGGNHIHHLNCGIFLLAGLGAYLLFRQPTGASLRTAAIIYGIGLALTFDEFGMWVRLGGGYWQRASLDAIGVVAAVLGLIAFAPEIKKFRPHHWWTAVLVLVFVVMFFLLLTESLQHAGKRMGPRLHDLEQQSPP